MNLDQLRTFATAAETLNFTQAARLLHISQPAVSQQIRELELGMRVTLFERRGRNLALTPAGERLRALAMDILADIRRAEAEMGEFRGVPQGVCHLGAESTPGTYLLPHALGAFSRDFPGVRISLRVTDLEAIERSLQDGDLDLAVTETEPSPGRIHGWECVPFLRDELALIVPPHHPWASHAAVTFEELAGEAFILRQPDSAIRRLLGDRMAEAGFDPSRLTARFELSSTEGIKHAVMAGLGVGFASRHALTLELAAGRLAALTIQGLDMVRPLWLLRPQGRKLAQYQQHFYETLLGGDWIAPAWRLPQPG